MSEMIDTDRSDADDTDDAEGLGQPAQQADSDELPILTASLRPNGVKLLRAAMDVIERGGVEALRVEHLVKRVGLTIPEVYRQFGSRQGLVNVVQAERYVRSIAADRRIVEEYVAAATSAEEFRIRLNQLMYDTLTPERLPNLWRRANVLGTAFANPEMLDAITEITLEHQRAIIDVVQRMRQRNWVQSDADVSGAFAWFSALIFGRVLAQLDRRSPLHAQRWIVASLDVVNQELFARETPALSEISTLPR